MLNKSIAAQSYIQYSIYLIGINVLRTWNSEAWIAGLGNRTSHAVVGAWTILFTGLDSAPVIRERSCGNMGLLISSNSTSPFLTSYGMVQNLPLCNQQDWFPGVGVVGLKCDSRIVIDPAAG